MLVGGLVLGCVVMAGQAQAAGTYDGVYKGASTHVGGSAGRAQCDEKITFSVRVQDGVFDWRVGNESAKVVVGADGSFSAQSGRRYLTGTIANGKITGATRGESCNYVWSLEK